MENWRDIKGFEGIYQVSDIGRVKSIDREITYKNGSKRLWKGQIIRPQNHIVNNKPGYLIVNLCKHGTQKTKLIHILVADAFLENPFKKTHINHKNGNKTDNRLINLERATPSENQLHAVENSLQVVLKGKCNPMYGRHGYNHNSSKPVSQFNLNGDFIKHYGSATDAGLENKINASNIRSCCKGNRNKAGGFIWKYQKQS